MEKYTNAELADIVANNGSLDNETKSQIISILRENKKYGLVWEHNPEDALEVLKESIPIFVEKKEKFVPSSSDVSPNHVLIEGDNLHALSTLVYTHEEKIDLIYIDPPYNTGAKSWKYNNDYVDGEDSFKHSKFASFIEHRLRLAHRLLSQDGVIICAIDDYEIHTVRMIMDEVFGENNRLGTVVVVHNPRGRNDDTFIATMHEYLLFYAKNSSLASIGYFPFSDDDLKQYNKKDEISAYAETSFIRTGNNSLRTERPGLWYEIYYNPTTNSLSLEKGSDEDVLLLPINGKDEERCWRWGPETFLQKKDTELFVKKVKGEYKLFKKRRVTDLEGRKPRTVWIDSKYDASSNGIMLLQSMFDGVCPFPYPKSLYAVLDCLRIASKKDSIILDFFAGSGTTLHAAMMLNAEDGGHRQCILVTNNENNICEEVTYERVKKVITGYTTPRGIAIEGLSNNSLRYFKTELVKRSLDHQNKRALSHSMADTICLKEGCYFESKSFGSLDLNGKEKLARFFEDNGKKLLMIYDSRVIPFVVKELSNMEIGPNSVKVYIFCDGCYPYKDDFTSVIGKVGLVAMPGAMLNSLRYILPQPEELRIDDTDLSESELKQLSEDIDNTEE